MRSALAIAICMALAGAGCSTQVIRNPEEKASPAASAASADPAAEARRLAGEVEASLHFDTDSAVLKPEAVASLVRLGEVLAAAPEIQVIVDGHTDATGSDYRNDLLSMERARNVGTVLAQNGVSGSRILEQGLASREPVADNRTEEGRAMNRRAEVVLQ